MAKKQFPLRLDQALYDVLEHWASDELRSVNAHIEFVLRDAAKRAGRLGQKETPAPDRPAQDPEADKEK